MALLKETARATSVSSASTVPAGVRAPIALAANIAVECTTRGDNVSAGISLIPRTTRSRRRLNALPNSGTWSCGSAPRPKPPGAMEQTEVQDWLWIVHMAAISQAGGVTHPPARCHRIDLDMPFMIRLRSRKDGQA